jgi:hypothetical protein
MRSIVKFARAVLLPGSILFSQMAVAQTAPGELRADLHVDAGYFASGEGRTSIEFASANPAVSEAGCAYCADYTDQATASARTASSQSVRSSSPNRSTSGVE